MALQYMELFEMKPNMTSLESSMENLTTEEFAKIMESFNVSEIMKLDTRKYLEEPVVIIMMVLCALALGTNIISILATSHVPSNLFTSHFRLILSLAASDIMIVVSIVSHIVNKVLNPPRIFHLHSQEERLVSSCGFQLVVSINVTAHLISLLNLFAMAQDHYVAIIKPLHYHHIMQPSRVNIMIIILWVISFLGGFSNFYAGIGKPPQFKDFNICERALYSSYQAEYLLILLTLLCFLGISVIYTTLYCKIKYHNSLTVTMSKNRMHNRKALVTTLIIIGTFAACWLPGMIFQLSMIIQIHIDDAKIREYIVMFVQANNYLYILLLCNSLCDPIIYAIRLPEVQLGYIRFLSKYSVTFRKILHRRRMTQTWSVSQTRTSVNTFTDAGCSLNLLERNTENGNLNSSESIESS
ncbi:melanocortin receptor 4-like [Saccostrea echinata]|uniref:melanocortin receptor 4-like n=1 Tax=Saccostrea echinata TaxID=191078 RepID=UPI002A83F261|nr:melanocortin receptor 4-like [Saccostrea echinata]